MAHRLAAVAVVILEALLVAAKLLLEMGGGLVEAGVGFRPLALGLQHQASGQMQRAVGQEEATLLLDRHVGMHGGIEILLLEKAQAGLDVLTQCAADIEVLTGDFDLHGRRKYPCFALPLHMGAFS